MADSQQHHHRGDGDHRSDKTTVTEQAQRGWRRGRTRRYAKAERRPADRPNEPATYSTGEGSAEEYHYHRVPTYHHQYAEQLATGMENNPT